MALPVLLGKPPQMIRHVEHRSRALSKLDASAIDLADAALRVLRFPAVANKTFLISIGDRTVGGLSSRDPFVGPWQVPVSDAAVTLMGFNTLRGEAMAMGERTPLALIDPGASARMAVGEAIMNIAAARIGALGDVKLSANWMCAAGHPGEDAALYDMVDAVAMELCPELGVSIPVGKDSMSMKVAWEQGGEAREVTSPVSLIVSAFAPCVDVRKTLTPQLRAAADDSVLLLVDLGSGRNRLGGSVLAQAYTQLGDEAPDVDEPGKLKACFTALQALSESGMVLAYHDRSDGGLFATLCEMTFAGRLGVTVSLDQLVNGHAPLAALFNEELGAVLQVRTRDLTAVLRTLELAGLGNESHVIGTLNRDGRLVVNVNDREIYAESGIVLERAWSEMTWHIQRLRDNPACAQEEFDRVLDAADPGLNAKLAYDPAEDIAAPYITRGSHPRIAVLREQGVNGQIEMAAAFHRAGFDALDIHMSDIIAGRASLRELRGFVAPGGFSYGDVLGGGRGWASTILYNKKVRAELEEFFSRADTFALGVCNGCQMMAALKELVPGASRWPRFVRNRSEQFEGRLVMVEIVESPSLFFKGMAGSRIPIVTAHGEGRAEFSNPSDMSSALVAMRYIDNRGKVAETYPCNPSGSPQGITGLTTADGRFTIVMPHPERVFRNVQMSWAPDGAGEDSPWMRIFRNARRWVG
jgi:phosphoribosylformylglycinamidine synthase